MKVGDRFIIDSKLIKKEVNKFFCNFYEKEEKLNVVFLTGWLFMISSDIECGLEIVFEVSEVKEAVWFCDFLKVSGMIVII